LAQKKTINNFRDMFKGESEDFGSNGVKIESVIRSQNICDKIEKSAEN
jgi:hypothetical protein